MNPRVSNRKRGLAARSAVVKYVIQNGLHSRRSQNVISCAFVVILTLIFVLSVVLTVRFSADEAAGPAAVASSVDAATSSVAVACIIVSRLRRSVYPDNAHSGCSSSTGL